MPPNNTDILQPDGPIFIIAGKAVFLVKVSLRRLPEIEDHESPHRAEGLQNHPELWISEVPYA